MKVLHLLTSNRFSGAENVVCQIIGMMKTEPNMEMVYCSSDGQIREVLDERDIQFIPLKNFSLGEIKRVIKEQKPDIVHVHDMRASFYAAKACGNTPLISHVHNNNFDSRGISAKSIAYYFAARKAKHIFWVSQSSFDGYAFHVFFKKKSSVLYNIIDIEALYKKMEVDGNRYRYDVVYVGRLTPPKNPKRLMAVLRKVCANCPNIKIAVVGTGDLEEETKKLCKEWNLQNNIQFLGFQSNPLKMLHDAKVMVMTSRWEGTPMCALEAMALGVPIVSTPTDGLCELITDGKNGFLSDDDDILAERIVNVVTDNDIRKKLSEDAIAFSKAYNDIEKYKKRILEAYNSLAE